MSDEWVMVPRDLLQRVDAALQRHLDRHAPMRIPVDQTDSDLVQSDVQALIAAPAAPQQAEPVAWMAFGGSIVHAVTRNAMDPIEAERFDVPLYLHPPAAEVQRLRDAARAVLQEYSAHGGLRPSSMNPLIIDLHRAMEGKQC